MPNFEGNSSFSLPFILKTQDLRIKLQNHLEKNGIETRPLCSGNLLRQPFLEDYELDFDGEPGVDYLHFNGFFIGNNHLVTDEDITRLEELIDNWFTIEN